MAKKGLGRGLSSLMPETVEDAREQGESVQEVSIDRLFPNPDQPRKEFRQEQLDELASSIAEKGIIQPIVAEPQSDGRYMIIAGERRYRAAGIAELKKIPVVLKSFSDEDKLEIGLIENIQREDLNAIEEAQGYKSLMDRFGYTQDEVSRKLGKSRSAIANALRLLRLPEDVRTGIRDREISAGHAKALLSVAEQHSGQLDELYDLIRQEGLSVRLAEKAARMINDGFHVEGLHAELSAPNPKEEDAEDLREQVLELTGGARVNSGESNHQESGHTRKTPALWDMEEALIKHTGSKVDIRGSEEKGRIEIHYYSKDDLKRLYDLLLND